MREGGEYIYSKQPVKEVIELVIIGNVKDRWEAKDVEKYFKQTFFLDGLLCGGGSDFWRIGFIFGKRENNTQAEKYRIQEKMPIFHSCINII